MHDTKQVQFLMVAVAAAAAVSAALPVVALRAGDHLPGHQRPVERQQGVHAVAAAAAPVIAAAAAGAVSQKVKTNQNGRKMRQSLTH